MQLTMGPCLTVVVCVLLLVLALWRQPPETPYEISQRMESDASVADVALNHAQAEIDPVHYMSLPPNISSADVVPFRSLTAILPVNRISLGDLEINLDLLVSRPSRLHDVWIVCPHSLVAQAKRTLHRFVSSLAGHHFPTISLHPAFNTYSEDLSVDVLRIAARVDTKWVVILDEPGLKGFDDTVTKRLLNPPTVSLPFGPRGFVQLPHSTSCILPVSQYHPASYLIPPFTMRSELALAVPTYGGSSVWFDLGKFVSASTSTSLSPGGIVFASGDGWCSRVASRKRSLNYTDQTMFGEPFPPMDSASTCASGDTDLVTVHPNTTFPSPVQPNVIPQLGSLLVVLPSLQELHLFASVVCSFGSRGVAVHVILHQPHGATSSQAIKLDTCLVPFSFLSYSPLHGSLFPSGIPDIIITVDKLEMVITEDARRRFPTATLIRLPSQDLLYTSWMASLTVSELKRRSKGFPVSAQTDADVSEWHLPQIDISVITNNRPQSLTRLLTSLSNGRFFGDTVTLRLNVDRSNNVETQHIVSNYQWTRGPVFIHQRIIPGGLLPAVVESWFPSSNNSYGLLLEDDVEVSPLFYAWVKMSILRYRYGNESHRSQRLFGISLYQPKNIELKPKGREPFDARTIFSQHGYLHPSSPYLSQIPCSWGAVYFPEHWREFHDYLSARLFETYVDIDLIIVPNVRSNRWKKSWKKFFIELVYLRGYVMLYPNYENYLSLSTNHVEVGSHVKARTREKLELFLLPLMKLSDGLSRREGLLGLPGGSLPAWSQLPVLNLTGSITTLSTISRDGLTRRNEVTGCPLPPITPFDARDLMCDAYISPPLQLGSVISL